MKKRIGIFAMYSRDGDVYDYIVYWLEQMKSYVSEMYLVCNNGLNEQGIKKVKHLVKSVINREDHGYDAFAFKNAIINNIGIDYIRMFDELVLINDTVFGPLTDLDNMFCEMDRRECDFWAITDQKEIDDGVKMTPQHLQIYFYVIKSKLLQDKSFSDYWENLSDIRSYGDAVKKYEHRFTDYFSSRGFTGDSFIHMESMENGGKAYVPLYESPYYLITVKKNPTIKKKIFTYIEKFNEASCVQEAVRCLNWIKENTEYPVSIIWQYLLKEFSMDQIDRVMHLDYIPMRITEEKDASAVLIISLTNQDLTFILKHIQEKSLPDIEVMVVTNNAKIEQFCKVENMKCRFIPKEKYLESKILLRDMDDIWKKYKFVGFINDAFLLQVPYSRKSLLTEEYNLITNMIGNREYIQGILKHLGEDEELGALVLSDSFHDFHFKQEFWNKKEMQADEDVYFDRMNIDDCLITKTNNFTKTFNFWSRTEILKELQNMLKDFEYTEKEDLFIKERFVELLQKNGRYVQRIISEEIIREKISFLKNNLQKMADFYPIVDTEQEFRKIICEKNIEKYCRSFDHIFIYGCGDFSKKCVSILERLEIEYNGFIVSNGHKKNEKFMEHPVFEIAEVSFNENIGIIIAMAKGDAEEIRGELMELGYSMAVSLVEMEE